MTDAVLTLQEVADELGVHYMTAYRYVRLGVMDAAKSGGVWQVQRSALDRFREQAAEASSGDRSVRQRRRTKSQGAVGGTARIAARRR